MKELPEFGTPVDTIEVESTKPPSISPFDFVNAINYSKEDIIVDEWSENQYNTYVINKALSFSPDTVIYANEMNSRPHLGKKLQFSFLINSIRPKKRYNKWIKAERLETLEIIKQYYSCSTIKAKDILPLLNEDHINDMKRKLRKGGVDVQ